MTKENERKLLYNDTVREAQHVTRWIISGLMQAAWIVGIVLIQNWVNRTILTQYLLSGLDSLVITVAQHLFAISTLAPIAFFVLESQVVMAARTYANIRSGISTIK